MEWIQTQSLPTLLSALGCPMLSTSSHMGRRVSDLEEMVISAGSTGLAPRKQKSRLVLTWSRQKETQGAAAGLEKP